MPDDFRALPVEAWNQLVALLGSCERALVFPFQILLQVMSCTPKADGGERVISLVALVARVWSKCRCGSLGALDNARAGFWDSALAGQSALRAAAWRALGDETIAWLGGSVVAAWLDVRKFFDSLDPCELVEKLTALEFPPVVLYMQLLLHWFTRVLSHSEFDSLAVHVSRSILAGTEASCSMGRGYVYVREGFVAVPLGTAFHFRRRFGVWLKARGRRPLRFVPRRRCSAH